MARFFSNRMEGAKVDTRVNLSKNEILLITSEDEAVEFARTILSRVENKDKWPDDTFWLRRIFEEVNRGPFRVILGITAKRGDDSNGGEDESSKSTGDPESQLA
jgi:hypothetical protein